MKATNICNQALKSIGRPYQPSDKKPTPQAIRVFKMLAGLAQPKPYGGKY